MDIVLDIFYMNYIIKNKKMKKLIKKIKQLLLNISTAKYIIIFSLIFSILKIINIPFFANLSWLTILFFLWFPPAIILTLIISIIIIFFLLSIWFLFNSKDKSID